MQNRMIILIALLLTLLAISACQNSDAKKAADLIKMEMYAEALSLLQTAIKNDATNARLHFLFGQSSLALHDFRGAQTAFARAQQIDPGIRQDIGQLHFTMGQAQLASGDIDAATFMFAAATGYDNGLGPKIAELAIDTARKAFPTSRKFARECIALAIRFDDAALPRAGQLLADEADRVLTSDVEAALSLYKSAIAHNEALAERAARAAADRAAKLLGTDEKRSIALADFAAANDQSLKPGLAVTFAQAAIGALDQTKLDQSRELASAAISYDPTASQEIEAATLALGRQADKAGQPEKVVALGELVRQARLPATPEWGTLLLKQLRLKAQDESPSSELVSVARLTVYLDSSKVSAVAEFHMEQAAAALDKAKIDVDSAEMFYLEIKTIKPNAYTARITDTLWSQLHKRVSDLPALGESNFRRLYALALDAGPTYNVALSRFANALLQYVDGNHASAIEQFSDIAEEYPGSPEGLASTLIVGYPAPGSRSYASEEFQMDGYGWNRPIGITLLGANISKESIEISFRVRAVGDDTSLYWGKDTFSGALIGACNKLHVIDDVGNKYETTTGFSGGIQEGDGRCGVEVLLRAGEEYTISARFPMVSKGATSIQFISPEVPGRQGGWWSQMDIKRPPFG